MNQYPNGYLKGSRFRTTMLGIALPIILQMLLTNGLSFVDTMMIPRLGESEIAAVSKAFNLHMTVGVLRRPLG